MGRYICAIFIISLPVACFFYYNYVVYTACDGNGEKLIKEIQSPTFFISSIFTIEISFLTCLTLASEIWAVQKNIDTPKTYYVEAELVAKDTTTVFKIIGNDMVDGRDTYYETDIDLNSYGKGNYILLMSDNITREDKSDNIILAVYNTVGEINTEVK